MQAITVEQFLGPYASHAEATSEIRATAARFLDNVNAGRLLAEADGIKFYKNPFTGCGVAGRGNGGFRPSDCKVGAEYSGHKMFLDPHTKVRRCAIDNYDPQRELAAWSKENEARLKAIGILAIEDPRWTPTWCHWQSYAVPSGHFCYVPSTSPALLAELGLEVPDTGTAIA